MARVDIISSLNGYWFLILTISKPRHTIVFRVPIEKCTKTRTHTNPYFNRDMYYIRTCAQTVAGLLSGGGRGEYEYLLKIASWEKSLNIIWEPHALSYNIFLTKLHQFPLCITYSLGINWASLRTANRDHEINMLFIMHRDIKIVICNHGHTAVHD